MSPLTAPGDWRRSQRCANGACVEVARSGTGDIQVRDSKDPDGAVLSFDPATWQVFVEDIKAGRFDLPPGEDGT